MRTTVIIGGGLSGLAASQILQQHNIPYTLIEVKRRVGGAIHSVRQDGFVMDGGPSIIHRSECQALRRYLAQLHLKDELFETAYGFILCSGMQTLTDALDMQLRGGRLQRMAVSSIGRIGRMFTVCLENGLMFDARSLVVAAPARFVERFFYGYIPEISELLEGYRYDAIARLSLGYASDDLPSELRAQPPHYPFLYRFDNTPRCAVGYTLLYIGVRLEPSGPLDAHKLIQRTISDLQLPRQPLAWHLGYWPEADALSVGEPQQAARMQAIQELLPEGVVLIGDDYAPAPLQRNGIHFIMARIEQAQQAAYRIVDYLGAHKA